MKNLEETISLIKSKIKDKDLADARILCEKIIYVHSANPEVNYLMGIIYDRLNLIERAEEFLHKALNLDPNHYDTLVELSLFHEKNGHRERARIYRERAFRIATRVPQS